MADDYLWDRSGEPDPDIARLERSLSTLRHRDRAYDVPTSEPTQPAAPSARVVPIRRRSSRFILLAVAAALTAAAVLAWPRRPRSPEPLSSTASPPASLASPPSTAAPPAPSATALGFHVERIEGAPRVDATPIDARGRLAVGQWLETDPGARARISIADIGAVEISGRSRVRLTQTGPDRHRLDLERGSLSAKVDAPPRLFVVGTPAATAVDLGCAYTLDVDDHGRGLLRVTSGWVALEDGGRSSLVPAGASCETRPGAAPGTPSYEDAPRALRDALLHFDFENGGPSSLTTVLGAARKRDALTIWHLLPRIDGAHRNKVFARLAALSPPPSEVTEARVLRLDPTALDRWRDSITSAGAAITW
ncbi:Hypothetical protein A7982_05472 [Minicystis rosea]|nr:Hypothetical protein A7982_05472 [Minicystis rosea]